MKRVAGLASAFLLAAFLVSCAKGTPESVAGMINPGDEIDGMVFATDDEFDSSIELHAYCGFEPVEESGTTATMACSASPGDRIFFGNCTGAGGSSPEDREKDWPKLESEYTFDGQAINLPAFGYLDFDLPGESLYARVWNVMVENITPGTHTVQCTYELDGESGTNIQVITVSEEAQTFPTLSTEATPGLQPYSSEEANLNYFLYLPSDYGAEPQQEWPLLLFLHGLDKAHSSMDVLKEGHPLDKLEDEEDFPFIVVAPKGTGEYSIWEPDEVVSAVMTLLDEVQAVVAVDSSRIYLTGESAGGNGTWVIGLRYPDRFAALVPVMGYYGWPFTVPENICDLAGVPVWAFHGAKDEVVPLDAEQSLADALEACGGDVQFTVLPDAGHDLDLQRVYTTELYEWLLSQTLK